MMRAIHGALHGGVSSRSLQALVANGDAETVPPAGPAGLPLGPLATRGEGALVASHAGNLCHQRLGCNAGHPCHGPTCMLAKLHGGDIAEGVCLRGAIEFLPPAWLCTRLPSAMAGRRQSRCQAGAPGLAATGLLLVLALAASTSGELRAQSASTAANHFLRKLPTV